MKKVYYPEISFVRGIACLLVLLTHVTLSYEIIEYDRVDYFNLTLNQLARVGTPIFALISGFLLFNSAKSKKIKAKSFYISRFIKIVIPYIAWSIIYIFIGHITNVKPFIISKLLGYIFLGEGYVHLYFMIVVIQFYIVFPFLAKVICKENIFKYTVFSILITLTWFYFRDISSLPLLHYRGILFSWIPYFMMGGILTYYTSEIMHLCKNHIIFITVITILSLFVIYIEMDLPHLLQSDRYLNISYVPVFTLFFFTIYNKIANSIVEQFFTYIGNYSMGFYLVHMLIIGGLSTFSPDWLWQPCWMFIHFILTILFSVIMIHLILRIPFGDKILPVVHRKKSTTLSGG